jgi:flagellin
MKINHNIPALTTTNNLTQNNSVLSKTLEKLSSGMRINRASDDAAGLAISEKMRGQIRGLEQAGRNIQDAISLVQTAEGGLNEIHALLQRGRELAVQSSNGTLSDDDRGQIKKETNQILEEINNIASNTEFNGKKLLGTGGGFIAVTPPTGGQSSPGSVPPSTPDTINDADEEAIIRAVKTSMLSESERLIQQQFGIVADGSDITIFVDDTMPSGTLAFVSYYVGGDGKGFNIELHLNKTSFLDPNPSIGNDRIVAHEMTHAIMARSMNYGALPKWFKEGAAEFLHGADERVYGDIYWNGVPQIVNAIGNGTDSTWVNNSLHYSAGYTAVRYLHDKIKEANGSGIEEVMQYLSTNAGSTLDDALKNIAHGAYAGGLTEFVNDYKANGAAYINGMDLTNADTGAIGGYDADGGAIKTADSVIPDTNIYSEDPLNYFNEIWPTVATSSSGTSSPYVSYIERVIYRQDATLQTPTDPLYFQLGANEGQNLRVNRSNISTGTLGIQNLDMVNTPNQSISLLDNAIGLISTERSRYGAIQNRLEHSFSVTTIMSENLVSAESRIRDADIAKEMMQFTKTNILAQAGQSMLSQANQLHQGVLQLLR